MKGESIVKMNTDPQIDKWPYQISYKRFCQQVKVQPRQLYSELFEQHHNQFGVKNKAIAVKKLQIIVESTFHLANDIGFQSMTLRQLSKECEMSMGGLYAYIRSKDDLARLIYVFLNNYCESKLALLVEKSISLEMQLKSLIHGHIYLSELMQPWFYFAYMETKNLSKKDKAFAIQSELTMEIKIINTIKEGIKSGSFHLRSKNKPLNQIKLISSLAKAMLQDWYLKHGKYKKRKISADVYAEQLFDMIYSYLGKTETINE